MKSRLDEIFEGCNGEDLALEPETCEQDTLAQMRSVVETQGIFAWDDLMQVGCNQGKSVKESTRLLSIVIEEAI